MRLARSHSPRHGMTLLEVMAAMTIFLFSIIAIGQLMTLASERADDVRWNSRATRLAQSKMAEFVAGVEVFGNTTTGTFDEEPEWQWTVEASADGTAQNLWNVSVTVSRDLPNGKHIESTISQFVLDPTAKGNISTGSSSASSSSSSSSGGSQ